MEMRTKTNKFLLLLTTALLCFAACTRGGTERENVKYTLEVTQTDGTAISDVTVGSGEFSFQLNVASNGSWSIETPVEDDWVSIDTPSGTADGVVNIKVEENTEFEERTTIVSFKLNDVDDVWFSITQEAAIPNTLEFKSVSPLPNFDLKGGTLEIELNCNTEWDYVVIPESEWITQKKRVFNSLTLEIAENQYEPREAMVVFSIDTDESVKDTIHITQKHLPLLEISTDTLRYEEAGGAGEIVVTNNLEWNYTTDADWITNIVKEESKLSFTVEALPFDERSTTITISSVENPELNHTCVIEQKGKDRIVADMLDVVFNEDGTAQDISIAKMPINTIAGPQLMTYYNEEYGRYVAHFNNTLGVSASSSYYQVRYSNKAAFRNKLSDGHTLEVMFKIDESPKGFGEIKPFTSHQAGGTGIMLSDKGRGNDITFLPNVSESGNSTWRWVESGVTPDPGKYYHVVGVWDKSSKKAKIYVNGKLRATTSAPGDLRIQPEDYQWFGIGADPGGKTAGSNCFKGDIVIARIYDDPLNDEQAIQLYEQAQPVGETPSESFSLKDIVFLNEAQLGVGYGLAVYGSGFAAGDKIRFISTEDTSIEYVLEANTNEERALVVIPANFTSGEYRMFAIRGNASFPIGVIAITMQDNPTKPHKTQVIAHRGVHSTAVENSLESFIAAQELEGVYGSEFDVYITADGYVVSNHDATYKGDNGETVRIETTNYDDLPLRKGEKLPKLEAYFEQALKNPGCKLIIEIKSHSSEAKNKEAADAVVKAVRDNNMQEHVEFIAFNYNICKRIVELWPEARVAYLTDNKAPSVLKADGIPGLDYEYSRLLTTNRKWIAEAKELGIYINMFTVNNAADMIRCISAGADFITTDNCPMLISILKMDFIVVPEDL